MTTEELVEQILSQHPEISEEEILNRLHKEKERTDGLITNEVLLRMIAAELGIETSKETATPTLSTEHLIPGLNDITVVGRVVAVFHPKTFTGRRSGKVGSLLIVDQKGILRVVLWNDKAASLENGEVKVGEVIRFSHGYTRKGYSGEVELHLGDRGEIETNPRDVEGEDYPTIAKFVTKIVDITPAYKNRRINIRGRVKEVSSISDFNRQDSTSGKVMRLKLADETGETPVVVWNQKVDQLQKVVDEEIGLQVVNGKVKEALGGGVEIHIGKGTYVETFEFARKLWKIADLKEELNHVNVKGEVVTKPMLRNIKTSQGEEVRLTSFELKDETGKIWVSAWRRHADTTSQLKAGQKVNIKDAYVKRGYADRLELSTRNTTRITIFPEPTSNLSQEDKNQP